MRLSEDVIRYITVKQDGPLPTPRPSNKSTTQSENKDNPQAKAEPKENEPVTNTKASTSESGLSFFSDLDVLLLEGLGVGKGPSCLTVMYLITSSLSLIAFSILKICCPSP